ncbi:hypothetical protein BGZ46_010902 [Entomortierella lignicola]|nr:hypothetical protein BGZ46_010902 [Entomortierella lignicola]
MTDHLYQRIQLGDIIEEVCIRTAPYNNDPPSYYVLLNDIHDVFQNARRFKRDGHPVPFLVNPDGERIKPLRIAYYPNDILEVITAPSLSTALVLSPTITKLDIQSPQYLLSSSTDLLRSFNSSRVAGEIEQAEMIKSELALNLRSIEQHMAVSNENSQEMMNMQSQIKNLLLEAKEKDDRMLALQLEAKEKDDKMTVMQNQMIDMQKQALDLQNQALDRLAILQKHAHAILVQNFELHEYPIPRLFIILPVDKNKWDPTRVLENKFRLHFLCECGEHTIEASKSMENQIHLARHEGYEIKNGTEFYKKYGKYMLILMRALKLGLRSVDISMPHIPLPKLLDAGIDYSINYMEALSNNNPVLNNINTIDDYEELEGADLRQLDTFLRINDQDRKLGNLYRITTETGHVKWVCIEHYRLTYKEKEQKAFAETVAVNGGNYDWELGRVSIILGSRIRAQEFFNALAKARHVYDLDITFGKECTTSDLSAFEKSLRMSSVAILRLDLQQFQTSFTGKLLSASTYYEAIARITEHSNMREIYIALSKDFVKISNVQSKNTSHLHKLSIEMNYPSINLSSSWVLVNSMKTNTTLTNLVLRHGYIGNEGIAILSEALKTNTTLTTLDLRHRPGSFGNEDIVALSEALKANTALTTLDLENNMIWKGGAIAISEALKINTTLTTLNLRDNSIGHEGALALSKALKTNATLTTLNLGATRLWEEGALALSEALKTNATLTTLNLYSNSIGHKGALALSGALKTNTTLTTLDLSTNPIGNGGALALSEALKINTVLTTLGLESNSIGTEGAFALSEALKSNTALTTLNLESNSIGKEGALALSEAVKFKTNLAISR